MIYIYFYDCPRTGGTTIKRWCKNQRKHVRRVHYGTNYPWNHVPYKPALTLAKELSVQSRLWTFTMLRDPYQHTASLFAKIRKHEHAYCNALRGRTFTNWIHTVFADDVPTAPNPWGFSLVRFYDPDTGNLDKAIANIESMDYVGFTDQLDKDMNQFLKKAGCGPVFNGVRANVVPRDFKISDSDRKIIREVRADDFKLVNHFRGKVNLPLF